MEPTEVQPAPDQEGQAQSDTAEQAQSDTAGQAQSELALSNEATTPAVPLDTAQLKAIVEAVIYITDEPLSADQIATALREPAARIGEVLAELTAEYNRPDRGLTLREVAGGYKMSTKPEHHEAVRAFVKNLKPSLKLSLPALETLALIAYKQPITAPEIMEVRGVQGAGVLKTLLDRKLIATAGHKTVLGKPILYKTTKEFLVQFGLKDLSELPTLKEFEEIGRLSLADSELPPDPAPESAETEPAVAEEKPD
jgi:segregation and condensation protein B